jgi:hypothetical protein
MRESTYLEPTPRTKQYTIRASSFRTGTVFFAASAFGAKLVSILHHQPDKMYVFREACFRQLDLVVLLPYDLIQDTLKHIFLKYNGDHF